MEAKRMRCRVIRNGRLRIRVELDDDAAGFVREKMRERRIVTGARDAQPDVLHIPPGMGPCVGNVQGKMFEFHTWKARRSGDRMNRIYGMDVIGSASDV
jgi:hypothetical protein